MIGDESMDAGGDAAVETPLEGTDAARVLREADQMLLAATTETIGDPVLAAVAELDADGMVCALRMAEVHMRRRILGELGLHGSKAPTPATVVLPLQRLRASSAGFQSWAGRSFAIPT